MIQLLAYVLPPTATTGFYFFGFSTGDRKKISLRAFLVCLGGFWLAAAELTWLFALLGLYKHDEVLINTTFPLGAVGLGLVALSGTLNPNFILSGMNRPAKFAILSFVVGLIPVMLAVVDHAAGQHFYAFRIFMWTLALPWITFGYVHNVSQLYMGAMCSALLYVLPIMLSSIGFMFRVLLSRFGWIAEYWCAGWGAVMLLQLFAYIALALISL